MQRTQDQWQKLIAKQQASGQTQTAFCQKHNINPKYFSALKNRLESNKVKQPFVKAAPERVAHTPTTQASIIRLSYQSVITELPTSLSPDYVAKLIKALL